MVVMVMVMVIDSHGRVGISHSNREKSGTRRSEVCARMAGKDLSKPYKGGEISCWERGGEGEGCKNHQ